MATKKAPAMSPSDMDVSEVLGKVSGSRFDEAQQLLELHREVSGAEPVVWAGRIIGFGQYEYRYESGHSGIAPLLGFASNSTKHTIYLSTGYAERWTDLLSQLGKHQASKACLYITRLSNVDQGVLRQLLERTLAESIASDTPGQ